MKTSPKGIERIMKEEGCRLSAYLDDAGVPTIGYGHTKGVLMGDKITQKQAEEFLLDDLHEAELCVMRSVPYGLAPHQFDALVSLIFNIGTGAFRKSTMLKKLLESDILGAANEFNRWNKITQNGKKVVSKGLTARRGRERALFLTGYDWKAAP